MISKIYLKSPLVILAMAMFMIQIPILRAQEIHLEDELILYLPMNGNAADESGHNVPTRVEGPVLTADRHGNPDKAYLFDGIDDNINLNNDIALITSKQLTICMWARIDGRSMALLGSNVLFEQRDEGLDSPVFLFLGAETEGETRMVLRSSEENTVYRAVSPYPGDGSWHFYTGLIDEDKNIQVYVDGEMIASSVLMNDGDFQTGITRVNIGGHHPESKITGAFNGAIDEVYIYNRALKLCEIEALFSGQLRDER